ncbi:MAG: 50S ribosomal protein L13 [Candidatus Vogelbacteria bacterium]|nr:50S ribosomal protein L13 [Candidatus Vogelbacteria bacterium]
MATKRDGSIITIDAAGQALGRVASRAAAVLRGKTSASFERHILPSVRVKVINAAQIKIAPSKFTGKIYKRYSGYPGGLRSESLEAKLARRGAAEVFRLAIKRMLPNNKLRARLLKNLSIED